MAIEIKETQKRYRYNGVTLPDVPGMSPREIRDLYSAQYPELVSAEIEMGPVDAGVQEITFKRAVGTKGSKRRSTLFRQRVAALLDGTVRDDHTTLVRALQKKEVRKCSQAWNTFAQTCTMQDIHNRPAQRQQPPSENLPPVA